MPSSSTRPASVRARWAATPPEQRQANMRKARLALAVKELVDQAPTLSPEQVTRLRAILAEAPEGGGRDEGA